MSLLQPMMVAALLVSGMGVALLGSVKVPLARRLEIDEARVGGLVSIFGFTTVPVIFAAGLLTDLVGKQLVMVAGGAFMAVSLVVLARARSYGAALAAVVLMSAGWALMVNVGNVLTPVAFPEGTKAYATNLANVFFGLGAFLTPLLLAWLVGCLSLSPALMLVGCLPLVPALLALGVDVAGPAPAGTDAPAGLGTLLADPMLWLCGLALFFYGPLEASLAAWATTYLGERGVRERTAAALLSGFWLSFMAARLLTALTLPEGQEKALVLALGVACVVVLTALVLSRGPGLAIASVAGAGLVLGPIFPTLMAVLLEHFPASVAGRAVGLFFAIGGVGWTVVPILIGAYAQRTSLQRGFTVAVAAAVGLSAVALVLFSS